MRKTTRSLLVSVVAVALAMFGPSAPTAIAAGNADNAHACQKGGWQDLVGANGEEFKNAGQCTSYAAQGGTLMPKATPYDDWAAACVAALGAPADNGASWFCSHASMDGDLIAVRETCYAVDGAFVAYPIYPNGTIDLTCTP